MKKIPIWKNVVLIIAVFVIIILATFAWFYSGTRGILKDLTLHVGEATFIQISGDGGNNWREDLDISIGVNKNFKEISGNGTKFFAPVYEVVEQASGGFAPEIIAFEEVTDQSLYYEQTFDFRADADYDVYLAPESFVASVSEEGDSYIDGAIRVAFFEVDKNGNETLKCLWAPNSTVEYSADTNSFTKEGSVEPSYYYQKSVTPVDISTLEDGAVNSHAAKIPTADPEDPEAMAACGYNEAYKFMWSFGENLPENAPSLLTIQLDEGEALAEKTLKIKVWLEGHDRECVSQLSGQKFTMYFQFNADKGE